MSIEAQMIADRIDRPDISDQRRAKAERRGRDRRKPDSRINAAAPRRSLLKSLGGFGVALSAAAFVLTLVAGEVLDAPATVVAIGFEAAALMASVLLLALGSVELRLIEIRLELMMMNGGARGEDRRQGDRRAERVAMPAQDAE